MQTIWPRKEGSVLTSWYPVIVVVNTASPTAGTGAPKPRPRRTSPSASARAASAVGRNRTAVDRARSPALFARGIWVGWRGSPTVALLSADQGQLDPTAELHTEERRVRAFGLQCAGGD